MPKTLADLLVFRVAEREHRGVDEVSAVAARIVQLYVKAFAFSGGSPRKVLGRSSRIFGVDRRRKRVEDDRATNPLFWATFASLPAPRISPLAREHRR